MKTKWDLTLLYTSEHDPAIQKDLDNIRHIVSNFKTTYQKSKEYLIHARALKQALDEYEKVIEALDAPRPFLYFYYRKQINTQDNTAEAKLNKNIELLQKENNKILFFELELGKITPERQKIFLQDASLEKYHYFLQKIFNSAKYDLTEPEEKIMNLKSIPAHSLWTQSMNKLLNRQTILWKGKDMPIAQAQNIIVELDNTLERHELHQKIMEVLKNVSDFAEAEINAICIDKKINDELRGFDHAYSQTILRYQNNERSVLNLIQTVTENFSLAHRFYDIKAKLMGVKKLAYADRCARIGKTQREFSWKEGIEIIRARFNDLDPKYAKIFNDFLKNGQIDVYPKKGKTSGAFCSSGIKSPTFVLLNHTKSARSILTLAHEMGHAIHSELSKAQPPLYQHYSTSLAETASTLFEQFVFEALFENLSDEEKIIALHDKINDRDASTIFRQVACFNFELELHERIRKEGHLPKEEIAALMNRHMQSYLGPRFELTDLDGYFFVAWPHIRNFFYVYTYTFGQLVSNALYKKYCHNKSFLSQIETFLTAGGSKSPDEILADIEINISEQKFWEEGIATLKQDIDQLESLLKIK